MRNSECGMNRAPRPGPRTPRSASMKILVANLGSTSLKWRLFDCANSAERLVHQGGFERVTEYSKAIEDCLGQLRDSGAIATITASRATEEKIRTLSITQPGAYIVLDYIDQDIQIHRRAAQEYFVNGKAGKPPTLTGQPSLVPGEQQPVTGELHGNHTNGIGTFGEVSFPYAFPKSGPYRIWVQTKTEGRILTGVFDTTVAALK